MEEIKIFVAGDVVPRNRTIQLFKEGKTELLFNDFIPIIKNADISFVNFEAPIIYGEETPIKKSGPCLHTSKETMEVLKMAGFSSITLANNHFRDQGQQGVNDTINTAIELGIDYVGGGKTIEESRRILFKKLNNYNIAFINVCENEFSIATSNYGGSNSFDIVSIVEDIKKAKETADYVFLIIHGGIEHYQYPTPRMKKTYRFFVDSGADVVINHHQHCFSGYEVYKKSPIFYGLGNFCFDSDRLMKPIWYQGYAVLFKIKNKLISFELFPYEQCYNEPKLIKLKNAYIDTISHINKIISDDDALQQQFEKYAKTMERDFLLRLFPIRNKIFSALFRRNYIKNIYPKMKYYTIKNLLLCESHKEVLDYILKNKTI